MRMVTSIIACVLLIFAVLHAFIPHASKYAFMALYGAGAFLAFCTLFNGIGLFLARVLALGTTALMFFYFAAFFKMAPHFHETWYQSGAALEGIGMLLSAFAMIPVLSCYSCMLKADCQEALENKPRAAFFSVPDSVQEKA